MRHLTPRSSSFTLAIALLAALAFPGQSVHAAGARPSDDARWFQQHAFETLGVEEIACPESLGTLTTKDQISYCGETDLNLSEFKKAWRSTLKSSGDLKIRAEGGWTEIDGGWRMRQFAIEVHQPLWVLYNETNGSIALVFGWQLGICDPSSEEEQRLDTMVRAEGVTGPKRLHSVEPDLPSDGTNLLQKYGKAEVGVKARIDTDGAVHPLCVLRADPAGLGFEEMALESLRQWRFEPARLEGQPVEVAFQAFVSWKAPR